MFFLFLGIFFLVFSTALNLLSDLLFSDRNLRWLLRIETGSDEDGQKSPKLQFVIFFGRVLLPCAPGLGEWAATLCITT